MLAVGLVHLSGGRKDKQAITKDSGTNGCRWYAVPVRIVPALGQVSEYDINPPNKQCCDVFHEHESGSYFANQSAHLSPESTSLASDALSLSGIANVLAGEPAADQVNPFEVFALHIPHVPEAGHIGPVLHQHPLAVWFVLDLPLAHHPGPFQAEVQTTDASEHATESHGAFRVGSSIVSAHHAASSSASHR